MNDALDLLNSNLYKFSSITFPSKNYKSFHWHYERIKHEIEELSQISDIEDPSCFLLLEDLDSRLKKLDSRSRPLVLLKSQTSEKSLEETTREKARIVELEQKVSTLETLLGKSFYLSEAIDRLGCSSLAELVERCLDMLDETILERFNKEGLEGVGEVSELVEGRSVRVVAERLVGLGEVHGRAARVGEVVEEVKEDIGEMKKSVGRQEEVIEKLGEALERIWERIESNLKFVDGRISKKD